MTGTARLAVLGGTGDAYLVCALAHAMEAAHGYRAEVILHSKLAAVARLFPWVTHRIDDVLVAMAERNQALQRSYDNRLLGGEVFYAHPSFSRSGVRLDQLTAGPTASQADMYRALLQLPPETPLRLPEVPPARPETGTVLVIDSAVSWQNTQPEFWRALTRRLRSGGLLVTENDRSWSLDELLRRCAASEWVIGPQCGVMSILAAGRFPCRKTFATPSMDGHRLSGYWFRDTYPYGYVTKFDGEDYDVEEFKITDANRSEVVELIASGVNARRLKSHDPRPVRSVSVPLSPGDFLDRLAVLAVKREKFSGDDRAAIEREYQRYDEASRTLLTDFPGVSSLLYGMVLLHRRTFDHLERHVPAALRGDTSGALDAARFNRERVELKREVDAACRAPYTEVKSYNHE